MPKTRQQRIIEERAGHAPPRLPRRTPAKTPSANNTVAAGPAVPAAQSATSGPEAPQALVHVWADQNRYVYDPSHELTIPSALVPELVIFFIKKPRDHGTQNSATSSSSSATQVTPSLTRRQFAPILQTSRTEPQVPGPSAPMATHASFARIEQPFQQLSGPTAPLNTRTNVESPPQEFLHSLTPHDSPPACTKAPFQQTYPVQPTRIDQPVRTISQSVTPTHVVRQALNTSGNSDIVDKQASNQEIPVQQIKEVVQLKTRPMPKNMSSSKSQTGANGAARRKRRAMSGKPTSPAPIKRKLAPVPSDPKTIHALGLPSIFCKHRKLPAYTANGQALYGKVGPFDDYLKFHDQALLEVQSYCVCILLRHR